MAAKPLTSEKIALTEKKMDMALDDIIKLSKTTTKVKKQRVPNKSQKFFNNTTAQDKSLKMRHFMDSRSSLRQGVLAQRRSSFQGNQFPLAAEVARKAAVAPIHNRVLNRNRVVNWNKPRALAPPVQRKTANGGYAVKQHQPPKQPQHKQKQQQESNTVPKQRPQTLDSLFANMKEQRMKVLSQQNNSVQHSGGGQQRQQRGRGRFRN